MSYAGVERRANRCGAPCPEVLNLELTVNGNGKPGLKQMMHDVNLAIYGDKKNGIQGMLKIQGLIFKMLVALIIIQALIAAQILGVPFIAELIKHLVG